MKEAAEQWLVMLKAQADSHSLKHLDLLINATGLDYPLDARLDELYPSPPQARLFEGTPEHALAAMGPILVRVFWESPEQQAWLIAFLHQFHDQSRVLVLLSDWSFDDLSEHLRHCLQIEWDEGRSSGLLCYYDTRLFENITRLISPLHDYLFDGTPLAGMELCRRVLHGAVISWHWIDSELCEQVLPGKPLSRDQLPRPLPGFRLSPHELRSLKWWDEVERFFQRHDLNVNMFGHNDRSLARTEVFQAIADAAKQKLSGDARNDFIFARLRAAFPFLKDLDRTAS